MPLDRFRRDDLARDRRPGMIMNSIRTRVAGQAHPQGRPGVVAQEDHVVRETGAVHEMSVHDEPLGVLAEAFGLDAQMRRGPRTGPRRRR